MTSKCHLSKITGLPVTNFRLVVGGDLILYLGSRPAIDALTEWRLWIESAWRLEGPSGPLLGSLDFPVDGESPDDALAVLRKIVGHKVTGVHLGAPVLDLCVEFEGGLRILGFCQTMDGGHWELRHASGSRQAGGNMTELLQWQDDPDEEQV
ncbi:hypothetical protein HQ520_04585 [bacterium]|nr:hypothetical protein [bacterium]